MEPKTLEVLLPSGNLIKIREQNGADDEVLSRMADLKKGFGSFNNFLAGIIVNKNYTSEEILNWPSNDKYYALLKSRIFSLGQIIHFKSECPHCSHLGENYEEDLDIFDWDLSKPLPLPGSKDYLPTRIKPYPNKGELVMKTKLTSGREITYNIYSVRDESETLAMLVDNQNKNSELIARKLAYRTPEGWMPVLTFREFNPREMAEIRKHVSINDPAYSLNSRVKCENPLCGKSYEFNLISAMDFFYPLEIL